MILVNVSRELAKPLGQHVRPARIPELKRLQPDLLWRAEVAQIGADTCVVAEELYTGYLLVFCGLSRQDFAHFPEVFGDRLLREATAICKLAELYDSPTLVRHLKILLYEQQYVLNPEPLEEGRLVTVLETLEYQFLYDRQPLPTDSRAAFEFGYSLNTRRPKNGRQQDPPGYQPSALEALGNLCLNLMEPHIEAEQELIQTGLPAADNILPDTDNIVRVDFVQQRKLRG